jgi:hypothetical protein
MKAQIKLTCLFLLASLSMRFEAQVNIGSPAPSHPSATLEVSGQQGGFLPPRLTSAQRDSINSPAQGLTIFNSDNNCLEFFVGNFWQTISCGCTNPPGPPLAVNGPSSVCPGAVGQVFSTPALPGVSFSWSVPAGYTITSSASGSSITVQIGNSPGYVSVTPSNACGSGPSDSVAVTFPVSASGGTLSTHLGHSLHTYTSSGTFTVNGPCSAEVDILAIGGGGGAGGHDGSAGSGGGGGAAVYTRLILAPGTYTVGVGGGGGGGTGCNANGPGGAGGSNGGGNGGNAGATGCSGGGGGGGGWSGLTQGSTYYVIAGGGGGGGGSNEGTANDVPVAGGGNQPNGNTGNLNGSAGQNFSGDGGGGGGGGGGYFGGIGQTGLTTSGVVSGGGNYVNPANLAQNIQNGNAGAAEGAGAAGGAPLTVPNASDFNYSNNRGGGGNGQAGSIAGVQAPAGTAGIVIIRYPN